MLVQSLVLGFVAVLIGLLFYLENQPTANKEELIRMAVNAEANKESFRAKNMSAFVLGATGEVGKELLKQIVRSKVFQRVVLIGRRNVDYSSDPELMDLDQKIVDFERLDEYADAFNGLEVGFCCLGTTRGKAGKEGFVKVDHDYVMSSAKLALSGGCQDFHLVSSQGANAKSSFLYPRVKGEVEEELKQLDFQHLFIYRPAILMCDRQESRPGEALIRFLAKPIAAGFPTAMTCPTEVVATAMLNTAVAPHTEKIQLLDNKAIHLVSGNVKQ